jgi:hypothetical protein
MIILNCCFTIASGNKECVAIRESKTGTGRSDAVPSDAAPSCTISHNFKTDYAATKISSRLDLICTSMRVKPHVRAVLHLRTCFRCNKSPCRFGKKAKVQACRVGFVPQYEGIKRRTNLQRKDVPVLEKKFFSVSSHEIWKLFVFFTIAVHVIYHL